MRINRSRTKVISSRRANRPDQRIYRSLRIGQKKRYSSLLWVEIAIGLVVFIALILLLRQWL